MIKHIVNSRLPLLVYHPQGMVDETYLEAVYQAGALPILDTEFLGTSRAIEAIQTLANKTGLFGVRLTGDDADLATWLETNPVTNLDAVVISPGILSGDNRYPRLDLSDTHTKVLVEALAEIDVATLADISPAAVIVKGNEAGGRVSTKSSLVLMQWYLNNTDWPVFVHGGVGMHTGAGIFSAGAAGVVMDSQLYLANESPLAQNFKKQIRTLTENDTIVVGEPLGVSFRFFAKPGTKPVKDLKALEAKLSGKDAVTSDNLAADLYSEISRQLAYFNDDQAAVAQSLFYLGQDAVFADYFAAQGATVAEIVSAFFVKTGEKLAAVDGHDPLVTDSPLAREHGVTYPVMQGPMANISDTAEFARAVQDAGGLPFFAIGNLPPNLAEKVVKEGAAKCHSFGTGLVGIEALNPSLEAHLAIVKDSQVPFALFAGGSAPQVVALEASGTTTYLHTPSVMMTENAFAGGCKRFIFEGREAGGHVGNLTSLVLWENALQFFEKLDTGQVEGLTAVFAGGISSARASWFISGLTADMAARGLKIGIVVGSAYLFTKEIVETGTLTEQYQKTILEARKTFLVGQTVGLPLRTVETPFSKTIRDNEYVRIEEKMALKERKEAFERDNTCSLLIAAKAFAPDFSAGGKLVYYGKDDHYNKGNFSVGACLSLFDETTTIAAIHDGFFKTKNGLAANLDRMEVLTSPGRQINDEIAVIGIGCLFPGAKDADAFWENILSRKSFIAKLDSARFDPSLYWDADKKAEDKSYSKIAGQVDFEFNHARYGYTEDKSRNLSRSQQMVLEAAYQAVEDAGYLDEDGLLPEAVRERTGVILGSCHGNELTSSLHFKYYYPEIAWHLDQLEAFTGLSDQEKEEVLAALRTNMSPAEKYEPVHGVLLNMEAARIAHHLGATGVNYSVDAACATSFAALDCAVRELLAGTHDVMLVGGLNTNLAPETFIGFCKMGALSNDGSFPFDGRANGFVVGEGAGVVMLKRARQAIADGDHIYGIIKAVGSSSDGKGKAIAAPNPAGQELCVRRCLEKLAGEVAPEDIDYIEAHGTSTIMGDSAEAASILETYGRAGGRIGVSSVKSQIGHLLGGAGVAGLIKALLALKNKTLPPNGGFEKLADSVKFEGTNLYIIEDARDWEIADGKTRYAAASSFGFGGINYHCIIGEYNAHYALKSRRIFADPGYDFNNDRIVVAGLGVVLPGAPNIEAFWEKLISGESTVSTLPDRWFHNEYYARMTDENYRIPRVKAGVVEDYEPSLLKYRIPPKVAESLDRAQIFGLDAADQAIEQAGRDVLLAKENKTAVILGTIPGEKNAEGVLRARLVRIYQILRETNALPGDKKEALVAALRGSLDQRYTKYNEDTLPGLLSNIISGRIANCFGANGANFVVDASCASATMTFDIAVKALRAGEYDYVLAGGVDANLYPTLMISFKRLGLLSEDECVYFDEKGQGYIMGEGAAIAVLTTYKKAKENNMPIYGEIHGMGMANSVPEHMLSPSQRALEVAAQRCYKNVQPAQKQIRHLDVFALSHSLLDGVEMQAMENTFDKPVRIDNIKPRFGYFKAANPAVVLAKLMLMNRYGKLAPGMGLNPETSLLPAGSVLTPDTTVYDADNKPLWFAANVIGIGGNHIHMVAGSLPGFLLPEQQTAVSDDAVASAQPATQRAVPLQAVSPITAGRGTVALVSLVSGQGAQYPGMMRELYDAIPEIRGKMDAADQLFADQRGYSLLSIMFNPDGDDRLNQTENTQPSVFLASACIFDYLEKRGFSPDTFIGHSIGEYAALYCNRMLDFDTAFSLVITRGDVMRQATEEKPGRIMVVFADDKVTQSLIDASGIKEIWVANKNSPQQTAVSGAMASIDTFLEYLEGQDVTGKKLALSGAFHTPLFNSAAEKMMARLAEVSFAPVDFTRIISNTTAQPYPQDEAAVKELLVRQIISPVEFVQSVRNCVAGGRAVFVETGVGRILTNLAKKIDVDKDDLFVTAEPRKGEVAALEQAVTDLTALAPTASAKSVDVLAAVTTAEALPEDLVDANDFASFKAANAEELERLAFEKYQESRRLQSARQYERFNFCVEPIVVAGVSVGLPGKSRDVFAEDNFDQLLRGTNLIDSLSESEKQKIVDKNITRVHKRPDGSAEFIDISKTDEVIQLAGQLGYFDARDYGMEPTWAKPVELAWAAGLEALKDAGIPLVQQYRRMSNGEMMPDGYALPAEMQARTGVIMTSLFANTEVLANQMEDYFYQNYYVQAYEDFESMYYHLMDHAKDREVKKSLTDWFFKVKSKRRDSGGYKMDRHFIANISSLGPAFFAERIKAKGPNTMVAGACASTTQAISVGEDWIRSNRCDRVIVIGGEDTTSGVQNQWIGSGFLAVGAATVEKSVNRAAKPFDKARNGTILGAGAVSLILEKQSAVAARGLRGQAELLGSAFGNSAHHIYNFNVDTLSGAVADFVSMIEKRHNLEKGDYTHKLIFMSHETYTPARGGSADAEVIALRKAFPEHYSRVTIANTKGYTGHTLGAGIEDAVLVKALQCGVAPPIANLTDIPDEFKDLKLSAQQSRGDFQYGLHLSAGFGSHYAFAFFKRLPEAEKEGNAAYQAWLKHITGADEVALVIKNRTLHAEAIGAVKTIQPKPAVEKAVTPSVAASTAVPPAPAPVAPSTEDTTAAIISIIAEHTGYTEDMLEPDLDMEADLGIDTVKQVEVFGRICKHFSLTVPEDVRLRDMNTIRLVSEFIISQLPETRPAQPAAQPAATASAENGPDVFAQVVSIIAEHTGYTEDMLEPDLDMEADLGIDTVKQVEVFGRICKHFDLTVPEDVRLRDMSTIRLVSEFIAGQLPEPASAQPAVQAAAPVETAASADAADVFAQVVSIIAEHTGYTEDMLEPDLDMEADLGIDTVKQVEVFGRICKHFALTVPEDVRLRDMSTIRLVSEFIAGQLTATAPPVEEPVAAPVEWSEEAAAAIAEEKEPKAVRAGTVGRFVTRLRRVGAPREVDRSFFVDRTFLLTTDKKGFAKVFAGIITAAGGRVVTAGIGKKDDFKADMTDLAAVSEVMDNIIEAHSDISGVFHFSPLDFYFDGVLDIDSQATAVKAFFQIIKKLLPLLNGPNTVISLPSLDSVVFPYQSVPKDTAPQSSSRPICPVFAGMAGMLKTINKELADTLVKVVDFVGPTRRGEIKTIVKQYAVEVSAGDAQVECGYAPNGRKYQLQLVDRAPSHNKSLVSPGDTIVVTGGARGITMEILKAVAVAYKPQLVILGRSDISVGKEFPAKADERVIMDHLKNTTMQGEKPLALKKAAWRIYNARQSSDNIKVLEAAGAAVAYHAVDVGDRDGVVAALAKYQKIDGVIHAAGLEESAFMEKKEMDSFSRVFDVKVAGAANLMAVVRNKACRYFVGFSSVTAKFGNEAQVDYTCANDMLAKMVMTENRFGEMTGKVMGWTAWSDVGMASSGTVNAVLKERGVTFLPVEQGVEFFMSELSDAYDTEAVFTGRDVKLDIDGLFEIKPAKRAIAAGFPMIDSQLIMPGRSIFSRVLDADRDLFLNDHSLDDTPIMPGAVGAELMAQASVLAAGKGQRVAAIEDFSIPYGIKLLRRRPKHLMIETVGPDSGGQCQCSIHSTVRTPQGEQQKLHYTGRVVVSENGYKKMKTEIPGMDKGQGSLSFDGNIQDVVYHPAGLFMTGRFQTIQDILYIADGVLVTRLCDTASNDFIAGDFTPIMQFDPIMVDAMFQSTGVLEMVQEQNFSLPSGFTRARLYRPIEPRKEYLCIVHRNDEAGLPGNSADDSDMASYHLELADAKGNLYMAIEDFKMVRLHAMSLEEGPAARLYERVADMMAPA